MDHLCFLCLVFLMLSRLFIEQACLEVTCWERADLLALVGDVNCTLVTFSCGILGQVWYLIVSFPDRCRLPYFYMRFFHPYTKESGTNDGLLD